MIALKYKVEYSKRKTVSISIKQGEIIVRAPIGFSKNRIEDLLVKNKRVTSRELAEILYVSEPSIRRDLKRLEAKNLIKRVHGGALLDESVLSKNKIPFAIRELETESAKKVIAERASELLFDNAVIFLDASTTAYGLIPYIAERKNITVITNGVRARLRLAEYGVNTISTGGTLASSCLALIGEEAYRTVESYNADLAFFSCRGLSDEGWLSDISPSENYVREKMIKMAKHSYLLLAEEKRGKVYCHNLCHISTLSGLVTEAPEEV